MGSTLRVLLLEDNAWDARSVQEALVKIAEPAIEMDHVRTMGEALALMAGKRYDALLTDLNVPDSRGIGTIQRLRRQAPSTAIVVLTGTRTGTDGPLAIQEGADDYHLKGDTDPQVLARALRHAVERRALTAEALMAKAELEALMDAAPDLVVLLDPQGRLVRWNQRLEHVTGSTRAELDGRSIEELTSPDPEAPGAPFSPTVRPARAPESRRDLRTRDGRLLPYAWTTAPLAGADGTVAGTVGVGRDIAPRLQARADGLAAQRLQAEKIVRVEMLRAFSHGLASPLTPLGVAVPLLRRDALTQRQARAVDVVERSVERLKSLVGDLADIARIQAGQMVLRREDADLSQLVRDTVDAYADVARADNVAVEAFTPGPVPAHVDRARVGQVLDNLVNNALRFTPANGMVRVRLKAGRDQARVEVADSGVGLDEDQIAGLFRPFSQVHDPEKVPAGGSGLGLYICKGFIEAHGGRIWAESPGPGLGSTLSFTVPLASAPTP